MYYSLDADDGSHATFDVHATDGIVLDYAISNEDLQPGEIPAVTRLQAQTLAEQFASQHCPEFTQGQWQLWPEDEIVRNAPSEYCFGWYAVINPQYGTHLRYLLRVWVEAKRGVVYRYSRPRPMTFTTSTVPNLTAAQVKQLTAPCALYNVTQVPFTTPVLYLEEDLYGVQYLVWELSQYPFASDPTSEFIHSHRTYQVFDATGVAVPMYGYGGGAVNQAKLNPHPKPFPTLPTQASVRALGSEKPFASVVPPIMEQGRVWLRAELLRGLGAQVQLTPKTLTLHIGTKTLTQKEVGATWRQQGWWLPLKTVAERAGWQVTWLAYNKEAVVDTDPARTAALLQAKPTPKGEVQVGAKIQTGSEVNSAPTLPVHK